MDLLASCVRVFTHKNLAGESCDAHCGAELITVITNLVYTFCVFFSCCFSFFPLFTCFLRPGVRVVNEGAATPAT